MTLTIAPIKTKQITITSLLRHIAVNHYAAGIPNPAPLKQQIGTIGNLCDPTVQSYYHYLAPQQERSPSLCHVTLWHVVR